MKAPDKRQQVEGTCLVVAAAMVFALVALVVKRDPLPLLPATECRFLVSWAVAACFMVACKESRGLAWFGPPALRRWLLLKCAFSFLFIALWWAALRSAPVGDCIAIIYCSPIFTSLLGRSLLGETLPRCFCAQICLVVAGTLLVVDPPGLRPVWRLLGSVAPGGPPAHGVLPGGPPAHGDYTLTLLSLGFCAAVPIVTRKCRDCSWIEVEHVNAFLASAVLNPGLMLGEYALEGSWPAWPAAAPGEVALIVLAAAGSFVGIAMETKGYQLADAGRASMFRYVEVPFAYLLQSLATTAPVEPRAVLGATLILGSCALGALESWFEEPELGEKTGVMERLISPYGHEGAESAAAGE